MPQQAQVRGQVVQEVGCRNAHHGKCETQATGTAQHPYLGPQYCSTLTLGLGTALLSGTRSTSGRMVTP